MKLIIVFSLLNIFCSSASIAQRKVPLVENLNPKECNISGYASSIKYVALETNDDCLLGDELKIFVTAQYVFVHDAKTEMVYRFDASSGKYLNAIGKKGQGPGEYIRPIGLYVDDLEKKCFLIDFNSAIHAYTYEGKFIQSISRPRDYHSTQMERIGDRYVINNAIYTDFKKELYSFDLQGKFLKEKMVSDKSRLSFMLWSPFFYKHDGQCYYKNYLSETIYLLDEKLNMKPVYWIDCGKKAMNPKEDGYDISTGRDPSAGKIIVGSIKGHKDNLYLKYYVEGDLRIAVYNTKAGSVLTIGKSGKPGFTDDLAYGPLVIPPNNTTLYNSCVPGQLISWIYSSDIDFSQYQKGEFGKVLKQVDEDSNPIVRIVNLR